ncbi:MAG: hypothetical protein J6P03_02675, partial [Opitutales bacterium]|nr:hypothetical protein [Opitutales bacterium]
PATSIFNVMCFDCERGQNPDGTINCVSVFRDSLVPANSSNKSAFEAWMEPINKSELQVGILNGQDNYKLRYPYVPFNEGFEYQATTKDGWRNNVWQRHAVVFWYMAYQAAIEQGADVIFFLTTHWPRPDEYWKPMDDKTREKYIADTKKNSEEFERKGGKLVSEEVKNSYYAKAREAAKILIAAENVERAKKGIPPMVIRDPWGYAAKNRIPEAIEAMKRKTWKDFSPLFKFKTYSQSELFAFYEPIYKKMYDERHLKRPQFNMIIMLPKTDDGSWNKAYGNNARKWARANRGGAVKILRGAKPISEYDRSIKKVKAPANTDASAANKTKKAEADDED